MKFANGDESWVIEEVDGVLLIRCRALSGIEGVAHAFSTRRADGGDDFDLGGAEVPVASRVRERRSRFLAAAGFEAGAATILRQVHGAAIVRAAEVDDPVEADGASWIRDDGALGLPSVRSADCVPILIAARDGRAAAAVHAGWRGTAAGIAVRAVAAFERLGVSAADLEVALGPSIRPCCYPVGPDVARAVHESLPQALRPTATDDAGAARLDLHDVSRRQLGHVGVPADQIHSFAGCTACRPELFFSYRRDGVGSGRMMAAVGAGRSRP